MFLRSKLKNKIDVLAPVQGKMIPLESVNDPVFSEKIIGDGVAIQYEQGDVYAPVSGVLTTVVRPSCHAFGIKTKEGLEVFVHVGLETVQLKGEGFSLLKQPGQNVQKGDKILELNIHLLKQKKLDLVTPVIITNSQLFQIFDRDIEGYKKVSPKDHIFCCKKIK